MRRFSYLLFMLLAFFLSSCSGEKAGVDAYVHQSDAIFGELSGLGDDYAKLGNDITRELGMGPGQKSITENEAANRIIKVASQMKGRIDALQAKAQSLVERMNKLETPERASQLHEAQVKALTDFNQTVQMFGMIAVEITKGPKANQKKIKMLTDAMPARLKASQEEAKIAGEERQKLVQEFGVMAAATATP